MSPASNRFIDSDFHVMGDLSTVDGLLHYLHVIDQPMEFSDGRSTI